MQTPVLILVEKKFARVLPAVCRELKQIDTINITELQEKFKKR